MSTHCLPIGPSRPETLNPAFYRALTTPTLKHQKPNLSPEEQFVFLGLLARAPMPRWQAAQEPGLCLSGEGSRLGSQLWSCKVRMRSQGYSAGSF